MVYFLKSKSEVQYYYVANSFQGLGQLQLQKGHSVEGQRPTSIFGTAQTSSPLLSHPRPCHLNPCEPLESRCSLRCEGLGGPGVKVKARPVSQT